MIEEKYICNERNLEHAKNPKVGDYWHERLFPVSVVISVSDKYVTVLDEFTRNDQITEFDTSKPKVLTREDFNNRYRYGRIGNPDFKATETNETKNKFWCDVRKEKLKKYAKSIMGKIEA